MVVSTLTFPISLKDIVGGNEPIEEVVYDLSTNLDTRTKALEQGTLVTTDRYVHVRLPADVNANDVWERAIYQAPQALILKEVKIIPDSTIGQATNYMTLDCQNKDVGGAGTTSLGLRNVNSTNTITGMVGVDIVSTNQNLTSGQTLSLKKTVTSAGQLFPGAIVLLRYSYS